MATGQGTPAPPTAVSSLPASKHSAALDFQLHIPASQGERKSIRSERNSIHSIRSEERQRTWEEGPRMILSLSGPISLGKVGPSCVNHVGDRLHHDTPGM